MVGVCRSWRSVAYHHFFLRPWHQPSDIVHPLQLLRLVRYTTCICMYPHIVQVYDDAPPWTAAITLAALVQTFQAPFWLCVMACKPRAIADL